MQNLILYFHMMTLLVGALFFAGILCALCRFKNAGSFASMLCSLGLSAVGFSLILVAVVDIAFNHFSGGLDCLMLVLGGLVMRFSISSFNKARSLRLA